MRSLTHDMPASTSPKVAWYNIALLVVFAITFSVLVYYFFVLR